MDFELSFFFRNIARSCLAYLDASEEPCYVFVQLTDPALIEEFGDEVTIKTDLVQRLPRKDDYEELVALRQAIFNSLKEDPRFSGMVRQRLFAKAFLPAHHHTQINAIR